MTEGEAKGQTGSDEPSADPAKEFRAKAHRRLNPGRAARRAAAPKAFKYEAAPAPVISSISPNRCGAGGGTELTIAGKGFVAGTEVLLGRKAVDGVNVVDGQTLELKVTAGKHGTMVDVTVRNPDGKQATTRRAFQYDERYD